MKNDSSLHSQLSTFNSQLPKGYKQTEVGVIPEEWEVSTFNELFYVTAGGDVDPKRSASDQDETHCYPIYSNALTNRGLYGYCSYADHQAGSITITARGTLGFANFRDHSYTAIGRVLVLQPKNEIVGSFFADLINHRVKFAIESTGVPQLTAPQISIYRLPVPPLPEQRAIAGALSDVDALIVALDSVLSKKRDLKQAAMQQLLTGQKRLTGFHGEWESVQFSDIADKSIPWSIGGGPFGSNLKASDYTDEGVRIIQLQNIGDGRFHDDYAIYTSEAKADELLSNNIYPGEIILSKMGDPVARACFVPTVDRRYLMASDGIRLAVDSRRFSKRFVHDYINSVYFRKKVIEASTGSTRQRIGLVELRQLPFVAPPLDQQTAIAEVLSDMDAELAALTQRRDKTRALKQGMMQELLTGRTRLI
jgi:type I restriction enzyme, S subunit